ncbi:MAG: transaldolase [Verrucomicrobia bacterium]|nr:transaldolase [Verrucomicrobiota bacterium]
MSLLDALKKKTQLAADTASLSEIRRFKLDHATNNQTLIRQAITSPEYQAMVTLAKNKGNGEPDLFYDHLLVAIGSAILNEIPGTLSTQIDPQLTFDTKKILARCRRLISLFDDAGADCKRVILKIPASWEGISAAKILEKEQIRCNITLIFSLFQASAAFEANATMIAPYVGRVSDWFAAHVPHRNVNADPGVHFVQQILAHAKQLGCGTQVMAASFRSIEQIMNLVQSHYLTIGPKLLASLLEQPNIASPAIESTPVAEPQVYRNRSSSVNLDSARQSQIEAADATEGAVYLRSEEQVKQPWLRTGSERRSPSPSGKGEDEDRFGCGNTRRFGEPSQCVTGEASLDANRAASPNSQNLTDCGITKNLNKDTFQSLFSQDLMASTLFADGLQKFTKDYLEVIHLLHS